MEREMIKTFEEKKEHAELMRNIFGITAVLYIGFIIWIACIHRYEILWWAFNVWLLLVTLRFKYQSDEVDAELVLTYIDYVDSRDELLEFICKQRPWISVEERLPENDTLCAVRLADNEIVIARYFNCGFIINRTKPVTHWMPIPELKGGKQ